MTTRKIFVTLFLLGTFTLAIASATTIPFQLAGKLIIVRVVVDGQPGNFILDTGVSNLVLNARYFAGEPTDKVFYGVDGQTGNISMSNPAVELGDLRWKKVRAEVMPMLHLESSKGIPMHGLLGTNLFREYAVFIDFQLLEMVLYPLDKNGSNPEFDRLGPPAEIIPFKYKGSSPLITAQVGAIALKLTIDTGAEMNALADKYAGKLSIYLDDRQAQNVGGFGGQPREVATGNLSAIRIGTISCQAMKTAFVDLDHLNRFVPGPVADGILGYEFLSNFQIAFHFKKQEMYLWEKAGGLMAGGRQ